MVKVSLEKIEEARRQRLMPGTETDRERVRNGLQALMGSSGAPTKRGAKVGRRPVGSKKKGIRSESLNQGLMSRSPGSSQNLGLDFVRAVYADKTGQEPM